MQLNPYALALIAYFWWGFVPLYWHELENFPANELILFRIIISSIILIPLVLGKKKSLLFPRKAMGGLLLSGLLVGFNWFLYIWAVNNGHVIESSLGYFLNPLFNMLLGRAFLKEKLEVPQKIAAGFAVIGVTSLVIHSGKLPWIAIALGLSFALYGLVRKKIAVPTIPGTFVETIILAVPSIVWLLLLTHQGQVRFPQASLKELGFLSLCGFITTIPLLAFAEAATKIPLSYMGFFQFISPSIQFLLGIFIYKEPFEALDWISYGCIWMGLGIFIAQSLWRMKKNLPKNRRPRNTLENENV